MLQCYDNAVQTTQNEGYKSGRFLISKCGPRQTPADNLLWHGATGKNNNYASKDTTLPSTQAFLSLLYTCGENEKLEIWRNFFLEKLEI